MDVIQVLHMNKGDDETGYARNSTVQRKTISISKSIIEEAVLEIMSSNDMGIESMGVADLGCASGPNTLLLISQVMDVIHAKPSKTITELRVYLNDLFSNDFNSVFMSLPAFYNKLEQEYNNGRDLGDHAMHPFIFAIPGSFYGPLFPRKTLHFAHSSFSLHWLSRVPDGLDNKGKIYISKSSPQSVLDAYSMQFRKDFSNFLRFRARELVNGGRMVLSFMGRPSSDPTAEQGTFYQFDLLAHALMAMVPKGLIREEVVDSFNIPYYTCSAEELDMVIQNEGSFIKDSLESVEIDWDINGDDHFDLDKPSNGSNNNQIITSSGRRVANSIRVVTEAMLESHFGKEVMNAVFHEYDELVSNYLSSSTRAKYTVFIISLIRKN